MLENNSRNYFFFKAISNKLEIYFENLKETLISTSKGNKGVLELKNIYEKFYDKMNKLGIINHIQNKFAELTKNCNYLHNNFSNLL